MIVPSQVKHIVHTSAAKTEIAPASANKLQTGQLVRAIVLQQLSPTSVLLSLGSTGKSQVSAETKLPLRTGAELQLKVIQTGKQPLLQILNEQKASDRTLQTSNEAVRQALPKQIPITEFLANIKLIRPADQQQLTPSVQQAIQTVQTGIGTRGEFLTPAGIKKVLQNSGLFFESNLATNKPHSSPTNDFKGKLLQLLGLLNNQTGATNTKTAANNGNTSASAQTPTFNNEFISNNIKQAQQNTAATTHSSILSILSGKGEVAELQKQVESAVARIQLNQINSLPVNEQDPQAWLFELPIKDKETTDVFALKITEEDNQQEQEEASKRWSVTLSFDLNGLGDMHAKLSLGGEKISATVWAEEEHTFKLLESNLDRLKQRLADVDFLDPHVKCYKGKPEVDTSPSSTYNELINTKV